MALARLDIPGLMLYGGSIRPGHFKGEEVTIQQVFEAVGEFASGKITEDGAARARGGRLARARAPAAASSRPTRWRWRSRRSASRRRAPRWCRPRTGASSRWRAQCGELVMDVLRRGQRPSEVITKPALENAIAAVATSGGSTNGVLHLLAVAREMGVPLEIDEFDAISERTPLLCDLQPGGQYVATDLYEAGGVPLVLKRLQRSGRAARATRPRSPAARSANTPRRRARPRASASCARSTSRSKPTGGFAILRGNVAPDGCVVKLAGPRAPQAHRPGARVRRRGGRDGGGARARDQGRRRGRDPRRGPRGRPGDARDAGGHRRRSSARASARPSR